MKNARNKGEEKEKSKQVNSQRKGSTWTTPLEGIDWLVQLVSHTLVLVYPHSLGPIEKWIFFWPGLSFRFSFLWLLFGILFYVCCFDELAVWGSVYRVWLLLVDDHGVTVLPVDFTEHKIHRTWGCPVSSNAVVEGRECSSPMIATASAKRWPRETWSKPPKWAKPGARILQR